MNTNEILSNISADLLAFKENGIFLKRLFSMEAGKWVDLDHMCRNLPKIEDQLKKLRKSFKGKLKLTWLDYPDPAYGKGYCLIIFFSEELNWHNVAIYNKQHFLHTMNHETDKNNND
jgi:hypothetical protein